MGLLVVALLRPASRGHRVEGCLGGSGGVAESRPWYRAGDSKCNFRLPEAGSEIVQMQGVSDSRRPYSQTTRSGV